MYQWRFKGVLGCIRYTPSALQGRSKGVWRVFQGCFKDVFRVFKEREVIRGMEPALGFKIKVVERCGRSLGSHFPLATLWDGAQCERQDYITWRQEAEELPPCNRSNLVYENTCSSCNPTASKKGDREQNKEGTPSPITLCCRNEYNHLREKLGTSWGWAGPSSAQAGILLYFSFLKICFL